MGHLTANNGRNFLYNHIVVKM